MVSYLKTLDGVQGLQWCPTPGEDDTEAVDRDDRAVGKIVTGLCGSSEGSQQDVEEETTCKAAKQHLTATKLVQKGGSVDGTHHTEDRVDGIDKKLLVGVGNTGILDHGGHEVGHDVVAYDNLLEVVYISSIDVLTGPLPEESHSNDHHHSVAGSLGVIQLAEVPPGVVVASD